ncbi:MAG: mono/diheme cytochrome c family protein [Halioglobus sp.]|jgi:mono/diheme cytochrome c family protein
MRHLYARIPCFSHFLAVIIFGLFHITSIHANPVPADELSLENGALSYEIYCAECHGSSPDDGGNEWYGTNEDDEEYDFTDLIEPDESESDVIMDEDWPEWAELPDPGTKANDADVRRLIMEELVAEIDREYGEKEESTEVLEEETDLTYPGYEDEDAQYGEQDDSGRIEGATDLTDPDVFSYGTSEEDIFDSIANGTGSSMKGWRAELGSEEAIWDLVNFIRSYWGEEWY